MAAFKMLAGCWETCAAVIVASLLLGGVECVQLQIDRCFTKGQHEEPYLCVCCIQGEEKALWKTFKKVTVKVACKEDYRIFQGYSAEAVEASYAENERRWLSPWWPWKSNEIVINAFNTTCLGEPKKGSCTLTQKDFDAFYIIVFVAGVLLFLSSRRLSKNALFYYGTGISISVLASILILSIILSRFIPGKKLGAAVIVGGFSTLASLLQYTWQKGMAMLVEGYYEYIVAYVAIASLLSFALLYWRGPVSDPRSLDLIGWTIQLVAAAMIYWSAQVSEVGVGTIVLLLLAKVSYVFNPVVDCARSVWRKWFPPRPRLLTEEEYERQASEETKRALEELRQYCRSPQCDAWKVVSRLTSPTKFASFIEGTSFHVSDSELLLYNSEDDNSQPQLTSDDEHSNMDDMDGSMDFQLTLP